jgi:quinol monooxygenase YgiN
MAIGVIIEGSDFTREQYDQLGQLTTPDNQPPPGMLYHAAGQGESGFYMIEVWESQEAIQQFFQQKLGPALQQANIQVQPTVFQVTNIMKP